MSFGVKANYIYFLFILTLLCVGGPISKLRNDPVRIIHEAVDDTYDWMHAIFSTVSDLISFDDDGKGMCTVNY